MPPDQGERVLGGADGTRTRAPLLANYHAPNGLPTRVFPAHPRAARAN
jgi:hypothetical protein